MILEKLRELTARIMEGMDCSADFSTLTRESKLVEDACLNSISMLMLVIAIEEEFHIELPVDDASKCVTVGEIVDLIQSCIDKKA